MTPAQQRAANARAARGSGNSDTPTIERPKVITEEQKMYHFQLLHEYPSDWKPTDKKTGKPLSPPYPRYWVAPNSGVAYDENFKDEDGKLSPRAREWRYIEGQPSIWVDEQPLLHGMEEKDILKLLSDSRNQLVFEFGQMHVPGIQKRRLEALQIQDIFAGKNIQYRPKNRDYKLHNPEKEVKEEVSQLDKEFAAQKMAHECTVEHMIECAFIMGIPIDDQSEAGLNKIKLEFLKRAKYDEENPKSLDWFTGIVTNPLTHIEFVFADALANGVLSTSQQQGKLTWAMANQPIMDINPNGNTLNQLMNKYTNDDIQTVKLFKELDKE